MAVNELEEFMKNTFTVTFMYWVLGLIFLSISFFAQRYNSYSILVGYILFLLCFFLGLKQLLDIDSTLNSRL